ncbi:MAG: hypothetical protein U0271_20200 [Polyangiaceae bacterium]
MKRYIAIACLLACGGEPAAQTAPSGQSSGTSVGSTSAKATVSVTATTTQSAAAPSGPWAELPLVAVWRKHGTPLPAPPNGPPPPPALALRFAVFESGRFVFANPADTWGAPLREALLDQAAMKALTSDLEQTGVFDLPGNTYLVPDAPVLVTVVRARGREQILYWDEVETANYGININPKPQHLAFKKAWKAVSDLVRARIPTDSKPFSAPFAPPETWYLKPAVQSE